MRQFCKGRSIFTVCASAGDSHGEPAVVINGSKQIIAGLTNEIMDGIYGDVVSGKLSCGAVEKVPLLQKSDRLRHIIVQTIY